MQNNNSKKKVLGIYHFAPLSCAAELLVHAPYPTSYKDNTNGIYPASNLIKV